ncbi:MAG: branched-chain amino acid transport system II carrier protein [Lachnospiraceae bacterium]|nr:branched-chain amino acid transport system II carrier protein [Lachnospiraceae bacterium]
MAGDSHKKNHLIHGLTVGFALFAIFFGAGNLIFPPYLGMISGSSWWLSFAAFLIADAGLSVVAVLSVVRNSGALEDQLHRLGKILARILCLVLMLCIGPLVVIPRTCATTFELSIRPIFPGLSSWVFSLVFFAIVALLTIKPGAVVDIIGKYLTPILLIMLVFLCIKGIITPIGPVESAKEGVSVVRVGLISGYQTIDALLAIPLSVIVVKNVVSRGYTGQKEKFRMVTLACLVASLGLLVVYAGLTFLGATVSSLPLSDYSNTDLLVEITELLLQRAGLVVLGIIVLLACLTTAIGMASSIADYVGHLTREKLSYKKTVLLICVLGYLISNLGTATIVQIVEPLLTLIYPIFLTQVFLSFFSARIKEDWVFRGAALAAALYSIAEILYEYKLLNLSFVSGMPLMQIGLGWVLPAVFGGLLGWLLPKILFSKKKEKKE